MSLKQVLFVQGGGEGTHDDWDDKLVASLSQHLGHGHDVLYPRLPCEDAPSFRRWRPALEQHLRALTDGAFVVGHSIGGAMLLGVLAKQPPLPRLEAIALLAAPFVGEGGWSSDELELPRDLGAYLPVDVAIHFFHGLADDTVPPSHLALYGRAVPQAHLHRLAGRDHQLGNDLSEVAAALSKVGAARV